MGACAKLGYRRTGVRDDERGYERGGVRGRKGARGYGRGYEMRGYDRICVLLLNYLDKQTRLPEQPMLDEFPFRVE